MIPVLFYAPGSCAFGSIVALEWLAMPFRLCRLTGEEMHSEAYRKINPLGQVPAFKSGEGLLTESAAILQHIGFLGLKKHIAFRQGTAEFDHLNQVMSFLTTGLHTAMAPTYHPDRWADDEMAQEEIKTKAMEVTVPLRFKQIEKMFNRHGWLAGDHPTIADAYFYGVGRGAAKYIDFERSFPAVAKFFNEFKKNEAVVFAEAIEQGSSPKAPAGYKGEAHLAEFI